jgi:Cuticle protein CPCFC
VTFATLFAVAFGAPNGAQYPAGVDPAKCPNFPICDNAALHNQAPAAPQWQQPRQHWQPQPQQWQPAPQQWQAPAPQWNAPAPQWNAPAPVAPQWNHNQIPSEVNGKGGDKYPSGVNPQACPNYPYCDTPILPGGHQGHQAYRSAPLPGFTERLYPAGVSAASCPNYPEC